MLVSEIKIPLILKTTTGDLNKYLLAEFYSVVYFSLKGDIKLYFMEKKQCFYPTLQKTRDVVTNPHGENFTASLPCKTHPFDNPPPSLHRHNFIVNLINLQPHNFFCVLSESNYPVLCELLCVLWLRLPLHQSYKPSCCFLWYRHVSKPHVSKSDGPHTLIKELVQRDWLLYEEGADILNVTQFTLRINSDQNITQKKCMIPLINKSLQYIFPRPNWPAPPLPPYITQM